MKKILVTAFSLLMITALVTRAVFFSACAQNTDKNSPELPEKLSFRYTEADDAVLLSVGSADPSENPEPVGVMKGDADRDGAVTILDATRIQRYLVKSVDENQIDLTAADCDGDGKVTILDATYIQRKLIGLEDKERDTYYSFGDSLVRGQIGSWTGPRQYSTKGYPDAAAKLLHLTLNNQAVGGQGLIKDWALIVDTINALDMSDASLITVGWSGNDKASWRLPTCALGTYTDVTTVDVTDADDVKSLVTYDPSTGKPESVKTSVIGFYYTIMKLLQTKCPSAQIILVTGYGYPGGNSKEQKIATLTEQFTYKYTFGTGGKRTVKERYDELEKMANLHGWSCVNQSKGCVFNESNASMYFGDQAHPTDDGYAVYGNDLAPRIAALYKNKAE